MSKDKKSCLHYTALCTIMAIGVSTTPTLAQPNSDQKFHLNKNFIIAQANSRIEVSISGGSLSDALQQLSKQAGFQLVGNAAYLTGEVRDPVVGSYTAKKSR